MSDAIKKLHDYIAKSPSVVYPEDVFAYLPAIEAENAALRELVKDAHACKENDGCCEDCYADEGDCPIEQRMRELGVIE